MEQRREPTTNSTHMITPSPGIEPRVTLVGDECPHHCTIPAPCFLLAVEKALKFFKSPKERSASNYSPRNPEFLELCATNWKNPGQFSPEKNVVIYHFFLFHFVFKQKFARWQTRNANQETNLLSWLAVPTSPSSSPLESSYHVPEKDIPAINTR